VADPGRSYCIRPRAPSTTYAHPQHELDILKAQTACPAHDQPRRAQSIPPVQ
jgi:hypothetical protein